MAKNKVTTNFFKRNIRPITIGLATFLLIVSTLSFWITNNIYDSNQFANKVTDAITSEDARTTLARKVNNELLSDFPIVNELIGEQTQALISALLDTSLFKTVLRELAVNVNQTLTEDNRRPITLDISGLVNPLNAVIKQIGPNDTPNLDELNTTIVLFDDADLPNFDEAGRVFLVLGPLSLITLLAIAMYSWHKTNRNGYEYLSDVGTVLTLGAGLVLILTYTSGALITLNIIDPDASLLLSQIYDDFIANLRLYLAALLLVGLGLKFLGAYKSGWFKKVAARFA